jgi:hypothetical protein
LLYDILAFPGHVPTDRNAANRKAKTPLTLYVLWL